MLQNWKNILLLALPSFVSFATSTLTGTINLVMVGHLGFLIIAIVGVSNIIMYNAFALFSGFGHTVNYLVAQNFGAQDMKKGVERMYLALYLCLGFGVLVALIGWLGGGSILRWTGGSAELVTTGAHYLQIRFYAMAFGIVSFLFHGFMRGVGDTKSSMIISLATNVLMVVLTYALTYGALGLPEWGLIGAGVAILIGEAAQLVMCFYLFLFRYHRRFVTRTLARIDWGEMRLMLKEGGKLGIQEFSLSVSMYIFTMFVARLGDQALAANEVALNVMSFGFMPAFAFGTTATILVGQYIGQGVPLKGRRAGTDVALIGTIFLIALGTIELVLAEPIARIYSQDPGVYKLAATLIMSSAYLQIFDGLLNFFAGGLRGIGDTTFLLRISFGLSWLLFVPTAYLFIFVFDWGSVGGWFSLYLFLMVFGLSVMYRFYKTDWTSVRLKEALH